MLFQNIRLAFRASRKAPGFAVLAVATIALAVGVNSTIFSVVNAALLRPLPVDQPDRLVWVFNKGWLGPFGASTYPEYVCYRDHNTVFSSLAAYSRTAIDLAGDRYPEELMRLLTRFRVPLIPLGEDDR